MHLDVVGPDRQIEVERLRGLGATVKREAPDYTVMQDPEGNELCVIEPR